MTHVMAKGANISLTAAAVRAVLRWSTLPGGPDVDASALLVGPDGRVRSDTDFVFYNQPRHPSGVVRHLPKHRVPGSEDIADTIEVDLANVPADVDRVVLAGSAEEGSFQHVTGLRVLLYDAGATAAGTEPLAEFRVTEAEEVSALVCAELYRRSGGWKFRAVGQGYASGLGGLATDFGITVDEDAVSMTDAPAGAAPATGAGSPEEPAAYTLAPAAPTAVPAAPATPPADTGTVAGAGEEPGTYTLPPAAVPAPPVGPPGTPTPPPPLAPPAPGAGYGYPQTPPATP
ncbi:hypothetical protein GCM10009665_61310 [Kitasatospora nipponensis]|uniref:TerD domain-containing protein n=1 Tax=Kitasatospora nipponensis TaxID=258049 RepID=A0ABP4HJ15_9ACTN